MVDLSEEAEGPCAPGVTDSVPDEPDSSSSAVVPHTSSPAVEEEPLSSVTHDTITHSNTTTSTVLLVLNL